MKKYRMESWYWGNFITEKDPIFKMINPEDLVEYVEEIDGWHNSEEYKNGKLKPYKKNTGG